MMLFFLGGSLARSAFILFFLFSPFGPAQTEVVKSIPKCANFLLSKFSPKIPNVFKDENQNRYKPICQTYKDKERFLTLYDTEERIPVFSAFKFVKEKNAEAPEDQTWKEKEPENRPDQRWMIEPQLENESADKNMVEDDERPPRPEHQASNSDYTGSGYTRGHLYPSSYGSTKEDKTSTFTLTNVVPQVETFNSGSWRKMESCVKCFMDKFCKNKKGATEAFVVTGAKPSERKLNQRVNIPSMMWSAFCCRSDKSNVWLASAHWGKNVPDETKDKYLPTKTLKELYQELREEHGGFNIFPEKECPLDTTLTEYYSELNKSCNCPPQRKNNKNNDMENKNKNKNMENKNKNKNMENKNKNKNMENKNKNKKKNTRAG